MQLMLLFSWAATITVVVAQPIMLKVGGDAIIKRQVRDNPNIQDYAKLAVDKLKWFGVGALAGGGGAFMLDKVLNRIKNKGPRKPMTDAEKKYIEACKKGAVSTTTDGQHPVNEQAIEMLCGEERSWFPGGHHQDSQVGEYTGSGEGVNGQEQDSQADGFTDSGADGIADSGADGTTDSSDASMSPDSFSSGRQGKLRRIGAALPKHAPGPGRSSFGRLPALRLPKMIMAP